MWRRTEEGSGKNEGRKPRKQQLKETEREKKESQDYSLLTFFERGNK